MIYIAIILFLILLAYIHDYRGVKKNKNLWYNIAMWIFILLSGLRYRIGSDTQMYELSFIEIPKIWDLTSYYIFQRSSYESGFTIFMSMIKTIGDSFWLFLLVQSIIINVSVFNFFKRNTKYPFVAVIIYFIVLYYFINCEAARQGIALSILLFSWKHFVNNRWITFLACVIIASTFHMTALVFLFLPILKFLRLWTFLRMNVPIAILLAVLISTVYLFVEPLSQNLIMLGIGNSAEGKVLFYFNQGHESVDTSITTKLIHAFSYILIPFYSFRRITVNGANENLTPMVIIYCIISICTVIPMFYRLSYYFMPFYLCAISEALFAKSTKCKERAQYSAGRYFNKTLFAMTIIFILYKSNAYFSQEIANSDYRYYMRFYPYNSVLDKRTDENREKIYEYL